MSAPQPVQAPLLQLSLYSSHPYHFSSFAFLSMRTADDRDAIDGSDPFDNSIMHDDHFRLRSPLCMRFLLLFERPMCKWELGRECEGPVTSAVSFSRFLDKLSRVREEDMWVPLSLIGTCVDLRKSLTLLRASTVERSIFSLAAPDSHQATLCILLIQHLSGMTAKILRVRAPYDSS